MKLTIERMLDVLLVEDEPSILALFSEALRSRGHRVVTATDGLSGLALLDTRVFDVILSDVKLPRVNGIELFHRARAKSPTSKIIIMTAYGRVEDAVAVMKAGAVEYFVKPVDVGALLDTLARVDAELEVSRRFDRVRAEPPGDGRFVARSPRMAQVLDQLARFAPTGDPVLISGESGTGKQVLARELHRLSSRGPGPFVAIGCAALPDAELESELSARRKEGRSNGESGTLFLEDVAELSAASQARLLRLLDERGDGAPRVVTATHHNLRAAVAEGRFREDLYFRLKVLELQVPPLRDRGNDLLALLDAFLQRASNGSTPSLSARALTALTLYPFPGNVRELEHAVRHAVALSQGGEIDVKHLPAEIAGPGELPSGPPPRSLPEAVREFEREFLRRAMLNSHTGRASMAEALGISRKNLWEKLRGYGLSTEVDRPHGSTGRS